MNSCANKGIYSKGNISRLCEVATLKNRELRRLGSNVLLTVLTEGLCDSFDENKARVYDRMFSQVIEFCRRLPEAKALDKALRGFGIRTEQAMLRRKQKINLFRKFPSRGREKIKKAIVISRVTIGSDVAVTSIIMEKLKRVFPQARIVLIGSAKANELFGSDPRIKMAHLGYPRRGGLMERLNMWIELAGTVKKEIHGLRPDEYIVVDPDSRLTQLGLLPLLKKDSRYYFFESRSYRKKGLQRLGELAADWANRVFGAQEGPLLPYVRLSDADLAFGRRICAQLRQDSCAGRVVSVNFGFGGNRDKRVSFAFEKELVLGLLKTGAAVILDKGAAEEVEDVNRLVKAVKQSGKKVVELKEPGMAGINDIDSSLLVWEGRVGIFGALIAASDAYIGYDSAFQHIASALGVPTVIMFSGAPCRTFFERWQSCGRGPVRAIKVSAGQKKAHKPLVARAISEYKRFTR